MLREPITRRTDVTGLTILLVACASPALAVAGVEYNAVNLFNAAQPAFDITENRPGLELRRPTVGAINEAGQIVGTGDAGGNQLLKDARPFFYDPAQATTANLGDLSGDFADQSDPSRHGQSRAVSINNARWVVGSSSTTTGTGNTDDRPFLWFDGDANHAHTLGEMHELGLNPGATFGEALRVNNANQVLIDGDTGLYRADIALNTGVVSEPGVRSLIAPAAALPDMNGAGEVSYISGNAGFVWRDLNNDDTADANEKTQLPFMSIGSPNTTVFSINNTGQVVGTMRNDHARDIGFIWTDLNSDNVVDWADTNSNGFFEENETSNEVVRFHGDPGGINATAGNTFVFDINDHGMAVGSYIDNSTRRAFIYDTTLGMRFLDDLIDAAFPLNLREADAISNAGHITAVGRALASNIDQLALLTPLPTAIQGDLDGDGFVGINDLNIVLANWNQNVPPANPLADPSGDGFVGIDDLNEVLGNWNAGTPPGASSHIPEPASAAVLVLLTTSRVALRGRGRITV